MNVKVFLIFFVIVSTTTLALVVPTNNSDSPSRGAWDFQLKPIWQIDQAGDVPLVRVKFIRIHDNGNIYLFDYKYHKFFVFSPEGKFLLDFGKRGEGPGEYKYILNFFLVEDLILAVDMSKIHAFTLKGEFKKSYSLNNKLGLSPLFFLNKTTFVHTPRIPGSKEPPDTIELYDFVQNKQKVLVGTAPDKNKAASKSKGRRIMIRIGVSELDQNPGLVVARSGNKIFYGKNDHYQIHAVSLDGKSLFSFSLDREKRKPITMEFKKKVVSQMTIRFMGGSSASSEIKKSILKKMPDISTYFFHIQQPKNGLIYVFISDRMRKNGQEVDIFSSTGKYLYHADIKLPEGLTLKQQIVLRGKYLYAYIENDEGETQLAKYALTLPKE